MSGASAVSAAHASTLTVLSSRLQRRRVAVVYGQLADRGPTRFLSFRPPNILPALTFLTNFLSLLSSSPSAKHLFTTTLPSQTSYSIADIQLTTCPTLNFLQLALITIQRAPGEGVSGVAARGLDGGVAKEWEALVGRYRRISWVNGVLGQKEVQEVSEGSGR